MSTVALWWTALAAGAVVAVVAAVLLQLFLREVRRVERNAEAIWLAGKQVAANTATTWQLELVSHRLDRLAEEAARHDALLRGQEAARHDASLRGDEAVSADPLRRGEQARREALRWEEEDRP